MSLTFRTFYLLKLFDINISDWMWYAHL